MTTTITPRQYRENVAEAMTTSEDLLTGLPAYLGIRTVKVGPARMVAELDIRPELLNPFGSAHGGVMATPAAGSAPAARGTRFSTFPGGCVSYEFSFTRVTPAPVAAVDQGLAAAVHARACGRAAQRPEAVRRGGALPGRGRIVTGTDPLGRGGWLLVATGASSCSCSAPSSRAPAPSATSSGRCSTRSTTCPALLVDLRVRFQTRRAAAVRE